MKKWSWLLLLLLQAMVLRAQQRPEGTWQLNDFNTGKPLVLLKFEQAKTGVQAVVVGIPKNSPLAANPRCVTCSPRDKRHNQPLMGMVVLDGMQAAGTTWVQGNWLDLEKGFTYMANLTVLSPTEIKVSVLYGKMEKARMLKRVK